MRDPEFRRSQIDGVRAPHVAPVNALVDRLRDAVDRDGPRGWVPYVAPLHGGVDARLLMLLRDPGPMTLDDAGQPGSGFLCVENDDATAERVAGLMEQVGLAPADCLPWNAYPWYVNRAPNAVEIGLGVDVLVELLGLLPRGQLRCALLLGAEARRAWQRLVRTHPAVADGVRVVEARHASRQAFIGTADQRARWQGEQFDAFREAAAAVRGGPA